MPEHVEDNVTVNKATLLRALAVIIVGLLVIGSWFWWHDIYQSSQYVFWGMINNNLATTNVNRHVIQQNQGQMLEQDIQLEFGAFNGAHSLITLSQSGNGVSSKVKSETIGTAKADYSRYLSIKTTQRNAKNQPFDTSNILNIWAKTDQAADTPSNGQYFSQAIFTILPFGNFNVAQRKDLVKYIKDHSVYDITHTSSSVINGRPVYVYSVNINASAYIATMAKYTSALGLGDLGLDATQYQNSPALAVQLTVDKLSRHLDKVVYPTDQQQETFYSQGLDTQIKEPSKTIPLSVLQNRIQTVLQ